MNDITQDNSEINAIFVHSSVDDAGLDPFSFRILMHLSRRANRKGMAWPGIASIAATTMMSERKVREALRVLENCKMLVTSQAPGHGNRNLYELTSPSCWLLDRAKSTPDVANSESAPGADSDRTGTRCRFEPAPGADSYTREGYPNEGNPESAEARFFEDSAEFQKIPPPPTGAPVKAKKASSRDHEGEHHYPEEFQASMEFCQALADYFAHRRQKKNPATPVSADQIRKKLVRCGLETATLALHNSTANGWTGVFPEQAANHRSGGKPQKGADEPPQELW